MADRLSKISGTLQEMSGEELARQQGLPAAPPTPLGVQGIGASQDVAKMAGTPNQIRAMVQDTLKERTRTKDLFTEAERTGARQRFTVDSLQQRMNVLEGLGSLGERVPEYVRTQLQTATTVDVPNSVNKTAVAEQLAAIGITDATKIDAATKALDAVRLKGATPEQVTAALKALGIEASITDGTTTIAAKLAPFFTQATVTDIKNKMATVLQDYSDVKMAELPEVFKQFADPQNNISDAAAILGLTDEQFGKMTLGEVQAQLKAWRSRNFQDVDALRDVLSDPMYSAAEKDFARQRLAEMGVVGVTSFEQKTDNIGAQISEGDTVVVGGQAVKVSELMTDPKLKAVIADALDNPDNLKKLETTDADLAKWITNNKAALANVRDELLAGSEQFANLQKTFADKFGGDSAAFKNLFDTIIPGWNKAKDQTWDTWSADIAKTAPTLVAVLNEPPSATRSLKLKVLESLPADAAKTFSTASISSIVASANGDQTKAAQYAKDWYDSSQPIVTGVTSSEFFKEFKLPDFDADFPKEDFDKLTSQIIGAITGTPQSADEFMTELKRLAAGTPEQRSEAMRMYNQMIPNISRVLKNKMSPTNVKTIKEYSKAKREANNLVATRQKDLETTQARTSITPRPLTEVMQMLPEHVAGLNDITTWFHHAFGGIGNDLRDLLAGGVPERFGRWAINKGRGTVNMVDGTAVLDIKPTMDDFLLYVADAVRSKGNERGVSSASSGVTALFQFRDNIEKQAREEAAKITADIREKQAAATLANNQYSTFITGLLSG